jgi:2,3-bisphosphoglycerate-independent phosphoglycerate mutase
LKELAKAVDSAGGVLAVTGDHGNIEEMIDHRTGEVHTQHTGNPVPFVLYGKKFSGKRFKRVKNPKLGDVAPTLLSVMGVAPSALMDGRALF